MWLPVLLATIVGWLTIRLSLCLPSFKSKRPKKVSSRVNTMVVWGSGGHTAEMILLLKKLTPKKFSPVHCILAASDSTSMGKIQSNHVEVLEQCQWHRVIRSREVKQSWISTVFTTLWSSVQCLSLVWSFRPSLILCNGPGTCVPICYAAFLLNLLGRDCSIVFVESFCRVDHLSLTGRLLYPIADRFVVQWPNLGAELERAEYLGDIPPPQ